jgi:gamma-glutamyltranspeptidase/glutathione hydrolase
MDENRGDAGGGYIPPPVFSSRRKRMNSNTRSVSPLKAALMGISVLSIGFLPSAPLSAQGVHQVATSEAGVVATAHPLATLAGLRTLEAGGNAADAAVASAFAVAVVLPSMNSIGGRNQILVREPDGEISGIDGTTQIPRGYDPETAPRAAYGYATIGIPGVVAGLMRLHREHGSLPLSVIMAPAIRYAREGFRLLPQQEFFQAMGPGALAESEGARRYFLKPEGTAYRAGELLVQEDLANTLEQISMDGGESFYRGSIAETMARDFRANGGFVGAQDLAEYQAEDSRVVRGSYRGFEVVGLDVPAAGAVSIQALQIMENFDPSAMAPEEWAAIAGQAIGLASSELGELGTDTAAVRATSKDWAKVQAERIVAPGRAHGVGSVLLSSGEEEPHYTTHISVSDPEGRLVSLTQTVGPVMGSKVATPGLGFHYATTMGGYLMGAGPGERARSFISPLLVLKDGAPLLVLGAAGGARIVASVVQVVSRIIDGGMDLPAAMAAPRVFMGFDGTLEMETSGAQGWSAAQIEGVEELGLTVRASSGPVSFALVQALLFDSETGNWTAVSEPDGEGSAAGLVVRPPPQG